MMLNDNKWKKVKIGDIAEKIAMGPFGSNIKVSTFVESGVPIISGMHLKGFYLNEESYNYITEEHAQRLKNSIVHSGDVIFTHAGNVGQVAMIPENCQYPYYMISQRQFYLRCDKSKVLPEFIMYYLHSYEGQGKLLSNVSQVGVPSIAQPSSFLKTIEIPLPSLAEQSKIVSILASINKRIEMNTQINHNLEEQAKAIFKSWFVDFEPFNGKMPKSWLAKTLADVSKIGAGGDKPHCVSEIQTPEFQYPIYSNGLANDGLYGYASSAKIYEESITVSARGTIGFVCLRQEPYVPIVRLITLIPNTCFVSAKYLYLYLKGISISGTGTTQQQLTVPDFQKTSIMVPDNDTMKRFTICADSIFEQIKHNAKEMRTLAQLRDTLLPKLMSGEIDVSEVEV